MLTGPIEGRLLQTLVWVARPRLIVELGTYSGYSAQFMARALPEGGRVITCELDPERAEFARARMDDPRIEIRVGPALESLRGIDGPIDLAFVDADKGGYTDYYEELVPKLSERGLIVADNTCGTDMDGIPEFNEHVRRDDRTVQVLLTVRDGVTLIRRV
jgi:caffeoyl-CoA O-methyltransferase